MRTLHRNSGQNKREWSIFGWLIIFNIAEDPDKSFLMRRWAWQNENLGMETIPFFSIGRVYFYYDDGSFVRMFRIILGPFKVNFAKDQKF